MNLLLKQYVKNYLTEATSKIAFPAKDIKGKLQHEIGASYQNDMTNLDTEEVLLKVLENVGNNCFLSFVDKYDEKIPRLEVNPEVSYHTPHGNYAYPLTVKTLKEIIEEESIGDAEFALNKPYFHMFKKSNNVNAINIEENGRNNYSGDFRKDLKTIVHTAIMFEASKFLEKRSKKDTSAMSSDDKNNMLTKKKNQIKKDIKKDKGYDFSKVKAVPGYFSREEGEFGDSLRSLVKKLCELFYLNNNQFPANETRLIVNFISQQVFDMSNSNLNTFINKKTKKSISEFHILYYGCILLAKVMSGEDKYSYSNEEVVSQSKGPVLTMLLNSIDIDFINDKGSSTLHINEPIQAVYLNSSKKESVVLIGTFNNIFNPKKIADISKSTKNVTMQKIISMIEKNKSLLDLFDSELFDNPKFEKDIQAIRQEAWENLTSEKSIMLKLKEFHKKNNVFNFDVNINTNNHNMITFNIGLKDEFISASINDKLTKIYHSTNQMRQGEDCFVHIYNFLTNRDYEKKNIYMLQDESSLQIMNQNEKEIKDWLANYKGSDKPNVERLITKPFFSTLSYVKPFCIMASSTNKTPNEDIEM